MLRTVIVLIVLVVALVRGGSLVGFARLRLSFLPLVLGSLLIQLLIFSPFSLSTFLAPVSIPLYLISMLMLVIWVGLNRHIPGIILIAAGVLMNLAAIVANGGYMPVAPDAARYAGTVAAFEQAGPTVNNSHATDTGVQLWILTDIFPIPAGIPLATVISLGDILLTVGASVLIYRTMRGTVEGEALNQPSYSTHSG